MTDTASAYDTQPRFSGPDLTHIAHTALYAWADNPRKDPGDEKALKALADSIVREGRVLQNLVVRQNRDGGDTYDIIAGERRWRAAGIAIDKGKLPADFTLPCLVLNADTEDADCLRMALAENIQRANMHPLEEGEGLARLARLEGVPTADLAKDSKRSARWVQNRIQLAERLSDPAKEALRNDKITLAQAEALMPLPKTAQDDWVKKIEKPGNYWSSMTADRLAAEAIRTFPPESAAFFDVALYTGEWVGTNRGQERRFGDPELFLKLTREAAAAKASALAEQWSHVEVVDETSGQEFTLWDWEQVGKKRDACAVVWIKTPDIEIDHVTVEVLEGLRRKAPAEPQAAKAAAGKGDSGKPATSSTLTQKHLTFAHHEKTRALQMAVAVQPQAAMAAVVVALLGSTAEHAVIKMGSTTWQSAGLDIGFQNPELQEKLHGADGLLAPLYKAKLLKKDKQDGPRPALVDRAALFRWLLEHEDELDLIFAALVAGTVGTWTGHTAVLGDDPLAIAMAEATTATVTGFAVTEDYLRMMRRPMLERFALQLGAAHPNTLAGGMTTANLIALIMAMAPERPDPQPTELEFADSETMAAALDAPAPEHPAAAKNREEIEREWADLKTGTAPAPRQKKAKASKPAKKKAAPAKPRAKVKAKKKTAKRAATKKGARQ